MPTDLPFLIRSVPRAGGGDPQCRDVRTLGVVCSPRRRGDTSPQPSPVAMKNCSPRRRGDPGRVGGVLVADRCSPRRRGCSPASTPFGIMAGVEVETACVVGSSGSGMMAEPTVAILTSADGGPVGSIHTVAASTGVASTRVPVGDGRELGLPRYIPSRPRRTRGSRPGRRADTPGHPRSNRAGPVCAAAGTTSTPNRPTCSEQPSIRPGGLPGTVRPPVKRRGRAVDVQCVESRGFGDCAALLDRRRGQGRSCRRRLP